MGVPDEQIRMSQASATQPTHSGAAAEPDSVEACAIRAVARAWAEHKRAGRPIVIWRNGQIVLLPPDQIPDVGPLD